MNARKRKERNRNLERNLYAQGGYYKYKHPQTGKFHGMGSDMKAANVAARKLNAMLMDGSDLVHRVIAEGATQFGQLLQRYRDEFVPTKKLKPSTLAITEYRLNRLELDLSKMLVCDMSVKFVADYLDKGFKNNAYIKMRGQLVDIFRYGLTKGIAEDNPAESTLAKAADTKQRQALPLELYKQIYAGAPEWLQIAMDFALITLQRRGDICESKHENVKGDYLELIQRKTEKHGHRAFLRIKVSQSLQEILQRSRRSGIASPYIIHRRPERLYASKAKTHWSQVLPETLSKEFAYYRDLVPAIAALPAEQRPTFHEIRALGGHLYLQAGFAEEYVQTLMGHSTAKMTAHYTDRHEPEWTECQAELRI
ncbi:tyrosine-type recombinase/integrase [Arsukibacterium sp.]|uniref:tyrosine-type recombinase/integrase n=1 Tax=Arsukibacterium sp. TaxID=1977258 RepID=UPI00299F0B8D|nr:tyrosine-type recombinase/integrase [Arsukibacterium sp.]MDX1538866.1 tyrosine-type recombinase/integrase [Arsukibacterium sp.]